MWWWIASRKCKWSNRMTYPVLSAEICMKRKTFFRFRHWENSEVDLTSRRYDDTEVLATLHKLTDCKRRAINIISGRDAQLSVGTVCLSRASVYLFWFERWKWNRKFHSRGSNAHRLSSFWPSNQTSGGRTSFVQWPSAAVDISVVNLAIFWIKMGFLNSEISNYISDHNAV